MQIERIVGNYVGNKIMRTGQYGVLLFALANGGCSSDSGVSFDLLSIKAGHQNAIYKKEDNRTESDKAMFKTDAQPYNKSSLTDNGLANTDIWNHYKSKRAEAKKNE